MQQGAEHQGDLLTVPQAARRAHRSEATINRWMARGALHPIHDHGSVRISRDELDAIFAPDEPVSPTQRAALDRALAKAPRLADHPEAAARIATLLGLRTTALPPGSGSGVNPA